MMLRKAGTETEAERLFPAIQSDVYESLDLVAAQVADSWKERISIDVEYLAGPRGGVVTIRSKPGEAPRRDTHNLHDSIQTSIETDDGQVSAAVDTDVFYAPILEDKMERPHFQVTFDEWTDEVIEAVAQAVERPART
jgi:hypothetical protein